MSYPGGKSASGVYQFIINQIPPHRVYIETHLGGGAVMLNKKKADINIGIDLNEAVLKKWSDISEVELVHADAVRFLGQYKFVGDEFVYVDPPYLRSTRKCSRKLYTYEYNENDHAKLLDVLLSLKCNVMVSGYWSVLYSKKLSSWREMKYKARVRSGEMVTEYLWMNYPEVDSLHDYQYLGSSFRERERIKRRNARWKERLNQLPCLERNALLEELKI